MATPMHWKDHIDDLRTRAESVRVATGPASMSPRTAAACLAGICGHISRKHSVDEMQRACAELVRFEKAWATSFGQLPHTDGRVSEATQLLACVARGLIPVAGASAVRDALSFWAVETDPAEWQAVALGAA